MTAAAQRSCPDKMLSVIGLDDADIHPLIDQTCNAIHRRRAFPDNVLEVANYLSSQGSIVSGHKAAMDAFGTLAIQKGAMRAFLEVSSDFHSSLMRHASESLSMALPAVAWKHPVVPVYSNVT
eukprot:jgi/Chlat1/5519/Chrsp360S05326